MTDSHSSRSAKSKTYSSYGWRHPLRRRGSTSRASTVIFIILRLADIYLQYLLLRYPHFLGLESISRVRDDSPSGRAYLDPSPARLVLLSMALGGALKQIIWLLFICTADVPIYLSAAIGGLNTAADTANTVLFLWASRSQNNVSFYFGIVLYIIGIYLELASELQRRAFKTQPRAANRGKVHTTGLFDLARHINYAGFALWRAGYAMAAAGIPWGVAVGGFFLWDFASRAVPSLEGYMREEYGDEWKEVERRVRWRLVPGVY